MSYALPFSEVINQRLHMQFALLLLFTQSCLNLRLHGLWLLRLLYPWDSPGKNAGVGLHALLQEIFPNQGSNLDILSGRQILYDLSHQYALIFTAECFKGKDED